MNPDNLKKLFSDVAKGKISPAAALKRVRHLPFEELGHSTVDGHRAIRQGYPEVIFCQGKTVEEIEEIAARICGAGDNLLATRASEEAFRRIHALFPDAVYHRRAHAVTVERRRLTKAPGFIAVVSAGTADGPVAEEAAVTAESMGNTVRRFYDVGVAGLHRLLRKLPDLARARVIVVAAGMEGRCRAWWGARGKARRRGPDERWLRREFRRHRGAARDAQQLRGGRHGGEHRQRFRSGLRRRPDQQDEVGAPAADRHGCARTRRDDG